MGFRTRTITDPNTTQSWSYTRSSAYGSCTNPTGLTNPVVVNSGTVITKARTAVMHDFVTPQWNRLRDSGVIINNPYDRTETITTKTVASMHYDRRYSASQTMCSGQLVWWVVNAGNVYDGTVSPEWFMGSNPLLAAPSVSTSSLQDIALTRAHSNVGSGEAQSLVIMAEAEKTIKSIVDILKRAVKIGLALRRLDMTALAREVSCKQLANRWMEARYAIRPLVYDMIGVAKALTKSYGAGHRVTYRSSESDSSTVSQNGVVVTPWGSAAEGRGYLNKFSRTDVTARAGVLVAIDEVHSATVWGLDHPIEAIWELIPFSFVVDWFFNVGQTLASWTPEAGVRELASWVVTSVVTTQRVDLVGTDSGNGTWTGNGHIMANTFTASGASWEVVSTTKSRTPSPLKAVSPTFKVRLDAAKLLDLVIMGRRIFR